MRIIFMGTPEFAVPTLKALVEAGHEVVAAYTQPPRPGGRRGKELTKTPVHKAAEALGIEVRHPASLKDAAAQAEFAALGADVAIVAAYGLILPHAVLDAPRLGCLKAHASLLPRWRGAAPVQRAILAGDEETGVTIMRMEAGLDTGPMLAKARVRIDDKSAGQLTEELAEIGANLMVEVLASSPIPPGEPQDAALATYAAKIDKAQTRIDFGQSAAQVERQVRAFAPAPGSWFELEGERFKVLASEPTDGSGTPGTVLDDRLTIACGTGAIRPTLIQRAGKPAMATADLLRGKRLPPGSLVA
jgi:methionyl-tRNA formyltransferase